MLVTPSAGHLPCIQYTEVKDGGFRVRQLKIQRLNHEVSNLPGYQLLKSHVFHLEQTVKPHLALLPGRPNIAGSPTGVAPKHFGHLPG